jgi:WXG100 family type VII secretion target
MPNIAVTPEQLQSVAGQLNAGAANIESTLSQLAAQVAPLQSEWQGVAQARFQELWAEWQRSSRGIQEALHGISQLTQQAAVNYGDTEQAIASSFSR